MVAPASPKPCAHCPWRISNQGKRHAGHWYTKANLRRLWRGLRTGDSMTCHPTDPDNPVPEGLPKVPEGARTTECCGALVIQQREVMRFQEVGEQYPDNPMKHYRRLYPGGMTREGLAEIASRYLFAGTPLGGMSMARPNLNDPDIGHPDLKPWEPR